MVVTNDPALAERVRLLRNHGCETTYRHRVVGGNFRLDEIQAAVLRVKLKYLDRWTAARQRNSETYQRLFRRAGLAIDSWEGGSLDRQRGIVLPHDAGFGRHVYNQFVIRSGRRDALLAYLRAQRIGCAIYYPLPLHLQDCFAHLGYGEGDFPVGERAAKESLALPVYPELTEEAVENVVSAVAEEVHDV
jgi:dTDP-4-amino-4,6-dideoxygalactose transaminase